MITPYHDLLRRIFDDVHEESRNVLSPEEYEVLCRDFVFHMTVCLDDLDRLEALGRQPGTFPDGEAKGMVIRALMHAPPHLAAAARILVGEVGDPFEGDESARITARHESIDWSYPD